MDTTEAKARFQALRDQTLDGFEKLLRDPNHADDEALFAQVAAVVAENGRIRAFVRGDHPELQLHTEHPNDCNRVTNLAMLRRCRHLFIPSTVEMAEAWSRPRRDIGAEGPLATEWIGRASMALPFEHMNFYTWGHGIEHEIVREYRRIDAAVDPNLARVQVGAPIIIPTRNYPNLVFDAWEHSARTRYLSWHMGVNVIRSKAARKASGQFPLLERLANLHQVRIVSLIEELEELHFGPPMRSDTD